MAAGAVAMRPVTLLPPSVPASFPPRPVGVVDHGRARGALLASRDAHHERGDHRGSGAEEREANGTHASDIATAGASV